MVNAKCKRLAFGVLTLLVLLECYMFGVYVAAAHSLRNENRILEIDKGRVIMTIQHETDPNTLPDAQETINRFRKLYQNLTTDPQYSYFELYSQPLYLSENQNLSTDGILQAEQVSMDVCAYFGLEVTEGRLLEPRDFIWRKGEAIPVLMGSAFRPDHVLGDTFQAEYLFQTFTFQIVGFLSPNSDIIRSNGTILLDTCVVMPSFEPEAYPETSEEYVNQKIHWANRTSGKLYLSTTDYDALACSVHELLETAGVGEYSTYFNIWTKPFWFVLSLRKTVVAAGILSLITAVFAVIFFCKSTCPCWCFYISIVLGVLIGFPASWLTVGEFLSPLTGLIWFLLVIAVQLLIAKLIKIYLNARAFLKSKTSSE